MDHLALGEEHELRALVAALRHAARQLRAGRPTAGERKLPHRQARALRAGRDHADRCADQLTALAAAVATHAEQVQRDQASLDEVEQLATHLGLRVEGLRVVPDYGLAVADPAVIVGRDRQAQLLSERLSRLHQRAADHRVAAAATFETLNRELAATSAQVRAGG